MTLTLSEVQFNLTQIDFTTLPKPLKNKGARGQLLELALGIPNSSKLTDMVDGELKSYTKGESIAVTFILYRQILRFVYTSCASNLTVTRLGLT